MADLHSSYSFPAEEKRILQSQAERESIEADLSELFPKVSELPHNWPDTVTHTLIMCH